MDTVKLRSQAGVRNDISLERFDRDAAGRSTGFTDLSASENMDLDETGKLMMRLGTTKLNTGVAHSLFSDNDKSYVVMDGVINHIAPSLVLTPICSVFGRVSYAAIRDATYWSDEYVSGMLLGAQNYPFGISVPPTPSAVAVSGDLLAGTYLFSMTYVRSTGEESGAPAYGSITVATNGGISFTLSVSADPLVTSKRLYVSARNGELGYLIGVIPNLITTTTVTALGTPGMALRTQFMGPPPAGVSVSEFFGRALVASENYLWYSQPYEYGLFNLLTGYVGFNTPVRTVARVADGVFIGTTVETFWLGGTDPTQWVSASKASYGTVLGTEVRLINYLAGREGAPGNIVGWMSQSGFCLGYDGGEMRNVTGGRHIPPAAREGASLLKIRGGTPQIVTTLFN